ncbi:hypothetical protein SISNIDRAFT_490656 [Sistotremastrum niveocremeum HHB9708]|uniref:F-box domain-containing protein n=1 Tax=Sistotremastrum niveocremeum HHB9708 TaxID=1314777 RepID=A0A164NMJ5_9AGAM|nr:hypothetical protein SISNIDRAFT_490656 [Sistotremastrum niveocremeum HHB9708]
MTGILGLPREIISYVLYGAYINDVLNFSRTCHRFRSLVNSERLIWVNSQDAFRLLLPPGTSLSSVDLHTLPYLAARVLSLSNLAKRREIKPIRFSCLDGIEKPTRDVVRLLLGRFLAAPCSRKLVFYSLQGQMIDEIRHPHGFCAFAVEDVGNGKQLILGTLMFSWAQESSITRLYSMTLEYDSNNAVISVQHDLLAECTLNLFGFESPSFTILLRDRYIICYQKDVITIVDTEQSSAIHFSTSPADTLTGPAIILRRLNHIATFNIHPTLPLIICITKNNHLYALRIPERGARAPLNDNGGFPTHSLVDDGFTGTVRVPGETASVAFRRFDGEWLLDVFYYPGYSLEQLEMISLRFCLERENGTTRDAVMVELVPTGSINLLSPRDVVIQACPISYKDTPSTLISQADYGIIYSALAYDVQGSNRRLTSSEQKLDAGISDTYTRLVLPDVELYKFSFAWPVGTTVFETPNVAWFLIDFDEMWFVEQIDDMDIPDVPEDVIVHIFKSGRLGISDILNFARASSQFRTIVNSSLEIWRTAYDRHRLPFAPKESFDTLTGARVTQLAARAASLSSAYQQRVIVPQRRICLRDASDLPVRATVLTGGRVIMLACTFRVSFITTHGTMIGTILIGDGEPCEENQMQDVCMDGDGVDFHLAIMFGAGRYTITLYSLSFQTTDPLNHNSPDAMRSQVLYSIDLRDWGLTYCPKFIPATNSFLFVVDCSLVIHTLDQSSAIVIVPDILDDPNNDIDRYLRIEGVSVHPDPEHPSVYFWNSMNDIVCVPIPPISEFGPIPEHWERSGLKTTQYHIDSNYIPQYIARVCNTGTHKSGFLTSISFRRTSDEWMCDVLSIHECDDTESLLGVLRINSFRANNDNMDIIVDPCSLWIASSSISVTQYPFPSRLICPSSLSPGGSFCSLLIPERRITRTRYAYSPFVSPRADHGNPLSNPVLIKIDSLPVFDKGQTDTSPYWPGEDPKEHEDGFDNDKGFVEGIRTKCFDEIYGLMLCRNSRDVVILQY